MPKNKVGDLYPIHKLPKTSKLVALLNPLPYGTLLSDESIAGLSASEKMEYDEYVFHVKSVKK